MRGRNGSNMYISVNLCIRLSTHPPYQPLTVANINCITVILKEAPSPKARSIGVPYKIPSSKGLLR